MDKFRGMEIWNLDEGMEVFIRPQNHGGKNEFTNMASWKITLVFRRYIFKWSVFQFRVSFKAYFQPSGMFGFLDIQKPFPWFKIWPPKEYKKSQQDQGFKMVYIICWFFPLSQCCSVAPMKVSRNQHVITGRVATQTFLDIFISIWGFPKMVVPPKHPKMIIFSRKTHGCWVPHFRKTPIWGRIPILTSIFFRWVGSTSN